MNTTPPPPTKETAIENQSAEGCRAAANCSEWVALAERIPEPGEYLAYGINVYNKERSTRQAWFDGNKWTTAENYSAAPSENVELEQVSHWMPMPTHPNDLDQRTGGADQRKRPGSGDGEEEAMKTRQMPYEPLPASGLFERVMEPPAWLQFAMIWVNGIIGGFGIRGLIEGDLLLMAFLPLGVAGGWMWVQIVKERMSRPNDAVRHAAPAPDTTKEP